MGHIYVEDIERLEEIKDQLKELVEEAKGIVESVGGNTCSRATSYWIPELLVALDKDHDYCASCMCTMENTITELREQQRDEYDSRLVGRSEIIKEIRDAKEHVAEFERSELNHHELQKLVDEGYVVVDDVDGDCYTLIFTPKGESEFSAR